MGKLLSLLLGAIIAVVGVILLIAWWYELLFIIRGVLPLLLVAGGTIAVLAGLGEFKDTLKGKKKK